jgi:hypothetical protein
MEATNEHRKMAIKMDYAPDQLRHISSEYRWAEKAAMSPGWADSVNAREKN